MPNMQERHGAGLQGGEMPGTAQLGGRPGNISDQFSVKYIKDKHSYNLGFDHRPEHRRVIP